jgi:hypothetical protein
MLKRILTTVALFPVALAVFVYQGAMLRILRRAR